MPIPRAGFEIARAVRKKPLHVRRAVSAAILSGALLGTSISTGSCTGSRHDAEAGAAPPSAARNGPLGIVGMKGQPLGVTDAPSGHRAAPAAPSAAPTAMPNAASNSSGPSGSPARAPSVAESARVASAPSGSPNAGGPTSEPALLGADGSPLPQTDERPRADSASFVARLAALVRAIELDDPSLAHGSFFPLVAYQQVKAIEKPERDYRFRLLTAFDRDIHDLHKTLGKDATGIRFERIEIPENQARWMKPGQEGNRLPYFRVLRSRMFVKTAQGAERALVLTSLISWRGEWYVVHLNGFK
ncbi:MAG TPA: hypothetical protein VFQ61_38550 [Polyangiaceae bacterium]|nr:hypothetical protein [Polyangiaceae bacterium]